jgi:hypothetical protein
MHIHRVSNKEQKLFLCHRLLVSFRNWWDKRSSLRSTFLIGFGACQHQVGLHSRPSFITPHRASVHFHTPNYLFNGRITNDKFCMTRAGQLRLNHWQRPLRLHNLATEQRVYSIPKSSKCGGQYETPVEDSTGSERISGRTEPMGLSVPVGNKLAGKVNYAKIKTALRCMAGDTAEIGIVMGECASVLMANIQFLLRKPTLTISSLVSMARFVWITYEHFADTITYYDQTSVNVAGLVKHWWKMGGFCLTGENYFRMMM